MPDKPNPWHRKRTANDKVAEALDDAFELIQTEIENHRAAARSLLIEVRKIAELGHLSHEVPDGTAWASGGWEFCQRASCMRAQATVAEYGERYG
jgi:hypothetical protein